MDDSPEHDLALRRRELEREFEDKARDLKAQHKRRMDALEQDRLDWERTKRDVQKQLADRKESARRQGENAAHHEEELKRLRNQVLAMEAGHARELDALRKQSQGAQSRRAPELTRQMKRSQDLLFFASLLGLLAAATLLLLALLADDHRTALAAALFLVLALLLEWRRRRLPKPVAVGNAL